MNGDIKLIDYLISNSYVTINETGENTVIGKYISKYEDLNKNRFTLLYWACQIDNLEMVNFLLSRGADFYPNSDPTIIEYLKKHELY